MINPETLLRQPSPTQHCTLLCPTLDRTLDGGVPCKSITELVSESGTGKTQLCLQLALSAQLPISHGGLDAPSIYIYTEFPFPSRRLHRLSQSFISKHAHLFKPEYNPCDRVHVRAVGNAYELLGAMPDMEKFVLGRAVRLVVVDSIAALFRTEFEFTASDLKRRAGLFFKIAGKLKDLAVRFDLAVVVTNQVVDMVGTEGGLRIGNLGCLWSSGRRVGPALGLAWANCVNSRLFLSRDEEGGDGSELGLRRTRRRLHVVFAPHLPASSCEFVIRQDGVFGVDR